MKKLCCGIPTNPPHRFALADVDAPTLDSVTPDSGSVTGYETVVLVGTGFAGTSSVKFGDVEALWYSIDSDTQITARTPPQAGGPVDVSVTTPGGTATRENGYTYATAVTVTSCTPSHGADSGGTPLVVIGTGFTGATVVRLYHTGGSGGPTNVDSVVIVSDTELHCVTQDYDIFGSRDVALKVVAPGGTGALLGAFHFDAIVVTSVNGSGAGFAVGGQARTITGSGFTGAIGATFGGSAVTSFVVVNDTTITCVTPAHAAGAVDVVVDDGVTTGTGSGIFTFVAAPSVSAITPSVDVLAGGASITDLHGTGFVSGATATIGGVACTSVAFVSAVKLTCVAPAGSAGAKNVVVTNPDTQTSGSSGNGLFTYYATPVVTSVNSSGAGFAAGGQARTITGSNFTGATGATFGGSAVTSFVVVNSTTITCVTPAHAAGAVDVVVSNPATSGTGTGIFTFVAAPTVTAITPTTSPLAGVAITDLHGTGFVSGATITIGGNACTSVAFVSSTQLTCTAPAGSAGAQNVVVTNPDTQTSGSSGNGLLTYQAAPTVTAITPNTGATAGGDAITDLHGTGFISGATATIDGVACTSVAFVSSVKLTCVTPAGSSGAKNVVVTNPDSQTSGSSGNGLFTYAAPFDPATFTLSDWKKPAPALPWVGTASAGTSGTYQDGTYGGHAPSTSGRVLDSKTSMQYVGNGASTGNATLDVKTADGTSTSRVTGTSYGCSFLVWIETGAAAPHATNGYRNYNIYSESQFQLTIAVASDGVTVGHYNGSTFDKKVLTVALGGWHWVDVRYGLVAGRLSLRVDGGAWANYDSFINCTPAGANEVLLTGATNYAIGATTFNLLERFIWPAAPSDADLANLITYIHTQYPSGPV